MTRAFILIATITATLLINGSELTAQDNSSVAEKKFELAGDFSTITFSPGNTKVGLGGRFTYNLTPNVALEAAGYFFPEDCDFCERHSGRTAEGLFGVKIGKRFSKWGIFGKARPGVITSSRGHLDLAQLTNPATSNLSFAFVSHRSTNFAFDVGGVLEFYPTKRIVTRMDFGSTIIHYGRRTTNFAVFDPLTGTYTLTPFSLSSETRGALQISAGVGFRF